MGAAVELLDWGVVDYSEALERQKRLFDRLINRKNDFCQSDGYATLSRKSQERSLYELAKQANRRAERPVNDRSDFRGRRQQNHCYDGNEAGWLVLCEHPHVYTLGKSGKSENLLVGEEFLRSRGAELYRTERGGDITYHGPRQIVGYPILDLERLGIGLRRYIEALEQSVIETVAQYGIEAGRSEGKTGVWVRDKLRITSDELRADAAKNYENRTDAAIERKICAIGVKASRGVVMHGFALNVATDLGWFELINPCGMAGGAVTSIEKEIASGLNYKEDPSSACGLARDDIKIGLKPSELIEEVKKVLCGRLAENLGLRPFRA
jgi:lipoyl(octanoyl) transferase